MPLLVFATKVKCVLKFRDALSFPLYFEGKNINLARKPCIHTHTHMHVHPRPVCTHTHVRVCECLKLFPKVLSLAMQFVSSYAEC